jgi:prophage regulatory protein
MRYKILRLPAVKAITGLSRSTIYLRMSEGTFPRAISLGARSIGWTEKSVQDWIEERVLASRKAADAGAA